MIRRTVLVVAILSLAVACRRDAAPETSQEPETLSVTRWTQKTELFAEYPPLVVGSDSRFAIHLTRLDNFKALTDGHVEVHLRGGSWPAEVFHVEAPSRPGIFGVTVKPAHAGKRELVIVLKSNAVSDEHAIPDVDVYASTAALPAETGGEDGGGISFLKEQQWVMEFATAPVVERAVQESIRVPAEVAARPAGAADVASPIDGRIAHVREVTVGSPVMRGQELARVLPPPSDPAELPQLQQLRAEAVSALEFATRDRERAERLVAAGAAPARRVEEARTAETQSRARMIAADARLAQHDAARSGGGGSAGAFSVRAPVTGTIAVREATAGANVSAGAVLFRIVDAVEVHLVGRIPEADAARAREASGAELEVPGQPTRMPVGKLASIGRVLDPRARTLPVIFQFNNRATALPVGQSVFLHLLMRNAPSRPVVPPSAIVDDGGRPVVYVQREGETFERRAVTLGPRAAEVVQVLDGVKPGERVVTRGAHLVRLASLSTQAPAHGHVH